MHLGDRGRPARRAPAPATGSARGACTGIMMGLSVLVPALQALSAAAGSSAVMVLLVLAGHERGSGRA